MRVIALLATFSLSFGTAFAFAGPSPVARPDGSTITAAQIDETVNQLMQSAHVTGVGIAIFHGGKIAYLKAYGMRDTEKGLPLTADSVMTSASLSKAAFATMVMRLVQERVLDLDKPIGQYLPKPLPDYPQYADLQGDDRWKRLTLRVLLSHTSGFPNWRAFEDDRKLSIHFEPGTRYAIGEVALEPRLPHHAGARHLQRKEEFFIGRTGGTADLSTALHYVSLRSR
jgi:CubicO group peptidase (beta-lactamase class C family)